VQPKQIIVTLLFVLVVVLFERRNHPLFRSDAKDTPKKKQQLDTARQTATNDEC
jgi:hypothetical protein